METKQSDGRDQGEAPIEEVSTKTTDSLNLTVEQGLSEETTIEDLDTQASLTKTVNGQLVAADTVQGATVTKRTLDRRDIKNIFTAFRRKKEQAYTDEIGRGEAKFYAQSKINDKQFIPDITKLRNELPEDEIQSTYDEVSTDTKDIVRTLDDFAFYDKFGNLIKLIDILEKPYYDFDDDLIGYGTLVKPLTDVLRTKPVPLGRDSNRSIVRAMLERPIPRGFRQSEFCTASPKNFKPKKKSSKSSRAPSSSNLNFNSPHYVPGVSREEAHAQAVELFRSVELPLKVGTIRVIHLGVIVPDKGYHNQKHLYPVGYTSERQYTSVLDPGIKVKYTSEISRGDKGPLFKVIHEGGSPSYEASTSSAVWLKVLKALNERKIQLGLPPKGTAISGPEMMGFAHKKIAAVIEGLPGVLDCNLYLFRAQRIESGAPKRKFAQMKFSTSPAPSSSIKVQSMEVEPEVDSAEKDTNETSSNSSTKQNNAPNVFDESDSFANKRQKVVHVKSEGSEKLSSTEVDKVKRLSKMLSLLTTNEEKQLYQTLLNLKTVPVDFDILYSTGLGKVVNRLRKHSSTEVASLAKQLKKKWVKDTNDEAVVGLTADDKVIVKKSCLKIVSYVGFGDDTPPKGVRSHESKNAPRKKLLESLNSLDQDFEFIPVDILVDTNVGARVNRLRKHLDEDIQMVALKLKGKWKRQIALEEAKQKQLIEEVKSGKISPSSVVISTRRSQRSSLSVEQFAFDQSIDIVKNVEVTLDDYQEQALSKAYNEHLVGRLRIKLEKIKGVRISHDDENRDATLWLLTDKARYRLCGERCTSLPSYRYYYFFKDAFHAFQSAAFTLRLIQEDNAIDISAIPPGLSQNSLKRAKLRLMLVSASKIIKMSSRCPCPNMKKLKVLKAERNRRLNFEILAASYETIVDEITRLSDVAEEIKVYLDKWFIDVLISRGNCYHAKSKRDNLKIEKDFFRRKGDSDDQPTIFRNFGANSKKAKALAGRKMVKEGINLPDDFEIAFDDKLPQKYRNLSYLPIIERKSAKFCPATPLSELPELSIIDLKRVLSGKGDVVVQKMPSACFGSLLSSWILLSKVSEEMEFMDKELQESFPKFRKAFLQGKLGKVICRILNLIVEGDPSVQITYEKDRYIYSEISRIGTRTTSVDDGYVKPISELTDETPSYAYNVDETYPYPIFLVTEVTWPAILKRLLYRDIKKESEKGDLKSASLANTNFCLDIRNIMPKPDLLSTCIQILNKIIDLPVAGAFSSPVNTAEYPNYLEVVKRPMDLNTVKQRIENGHYESSNLPYHDAYRNELVQPLVLIEPKPAAHNEESEDEEGEEEHDESKIKIELENDENGRVMKYLIKRKMRKAGKWRFKTEFQLQSELRNKKKEVAELTLDEKFYLHDCRGAGYDGVLADVRQVWRNCRKYNRSSTRIYADCEKLETAFIRMFKAQVIGRDPDGMASTEVEEINTVEEKKSEFVHSHLQLILPLLPEVLELLLKYEFSLLPVEHKVVLLEWFVNKLLENPRVRTLFVSKMDILQQVEREELIKSKLPVRSNNEMSEDDEVSLEAPHRKEIYLQSVFSHGLKLDAIGEDRYYNKYYGVYPLVKESAWFLKEEVKSGEWSIIENREQIDSLLSRLDVRGCRENKLLQRMEEYWLPLWEKSIVERQQRTSKFKKDFQELVSTEKPSISHKQLELQELLYRTEMQHREVSIEGKKWLAASAEGGKVYYYHEKTRETTWEKPKVRAEMEQLNKKMEDLRQQVIENNQTPEERMEVLLNEVRGDGEVLDLLRQEDILSKTRVQDIGVELATLQFQQTVVSLCARMQAIEKLTLGPSCSICFSQRHSQWCESARPEWYATIEEACKRLNVNMNTVVLKRQSANPQKTDNSTVKDICAELIEETARFGTRNQRNRYLHHEVRSVGWCGEWQLCTFPGYPSLVQDLKVILLTLYDEYNGSPYNVESLQAQEGILHATRHFSRWKRALDCSSAVSELGLLEAHLCQLLGLSQKSILKVLEEEKQKLYQFVGS